MVYIFATNVWRGQCKRVHLETLMTNSGQLAQTGVSWPIYLAIGLLTAGVGALMKLFGRGREQ